MASIYLTQHWEQRAFLASIYLATRWKLNITGQYIFPADEFCVVLHRNFVSRGQPIKVNVQKSQTLSELYLFIQQALGMKSYIYILNNNIKTT